MNRSSWLQHPIPFPGFQQGKRSPLLRRRQIVLSTLDEFEAGFVFEVDLEQSI